MWSAEDHTENMNLKFFLLLVLVASGSCCVPLTYHKSPPPRENELGAIYVELPIREPAAPGESSLSVNFHATPDSESSPPEFTTSQSDEAEDSQRLIESLSNPQDKALGGFNIPLKTNLIIAPISCPEGQQKDHAGKCRAPYGSTAEEPIATSGISQINIIGTQCLPGFRQDANGNCRKVWG